MAQWLLCHTKKQKSKARLFTQAGWLFFVFDNEPFALKHPQHFTASPLYCGGNSLCKVGISAVQRYFYRRLPYRHNINSFNGPVFPERKPYCPESVIDHLLEPVFGFLVGCAVLYNSFKVSAQSAQFLHIASFFVSTAKFINCKRPLHNIKGLLDCVAYCYDFYMRM